MSNSTGGPGAHAGSKPARLVFHPLVPDRWTDLERLFGARGACGGCWCMWWRLAHAEFERGKGEGNRRALRRLVAAGEEPGLLAYAEDEPVGWVAVAPRPKLRRLERSRILAPVDDRPVWSVVCFFVTKSQRACGVSVRLLEAAAQHVQRRGGRIVEGYPSEPQGRLPEAFAYTGVASAFRQAGFVEVARRSPTRPIMRLEIAGPGGAAAGRRQGSRSSSR